MKILENKSLPLDAEELRAWPFWRYGWYGTDGFDWREYCTARGVAGIEDIAEEASPLTLEQAMSRGLDIVLEQAGYLQEGAVRYNIKVNMPMEAGTLAGRVCSAYNRDARAITVGACRKEYQSPENIPEPLKKLAARGAVLTLDAKDVPLRLAIEV